MKYDFVITDYSWSFSMLGYLLSKSLPLFPLLPLTFFLFSLFLFSLESGFLCKQQCFLLQLVKGKLKTMNIWASTLEQGSWYVQNKWKTKLLDWMSFICLPGEFHDYQGDLKKTEISWRAKSLNCHESNVWNQLWPPDSLQQPKCNHFSSKSVFNCLCYYSPKMQVMFSSFHICIFFTHLPP